MKGQIRVVTVSEHEHARVSEFKTMLEYKIMLTRVWNSANREI